ncbi:hypothetical protein SCL_1918 [Sulfuricaulis limicola]|uniref:Lipoprotein n=1 Tax=Sulfuricaulis limicola TaxID=1620215 RepID=A0A1B4XHF1_9GAMM|nr:hypothetical protein [Sulfuricaulis limicola]BAV34209.1 hypothetical protein SCL_1918 [Sulfuricaulis limicola]
MRKVGLRFRIVIVLSVMPLMGFSCWRFDNYVLRPELDISSTDGIRGEEQKKFEEVLVIFRKWARSEQLKTIRCDADQGINSYTQPCEAYEATYAICGLISCASKNLQVTLLIDRQYHKIRVVFYDFGRWSKGKREAELQASLKSAIEEAFGDGAMIEFKEPNKSLQPTQKPRG